MYQVSEIEVNPKQYSDEQRAIIIEVIKKEINCINEYLGAEVPVIDEYQGDIKPKDRQEGLITSSIILPTVNRKREKLDKLKKLKQREAQLDQSHESLRCIKCSGGIESQRLEALPDTDTCITCANADSLIHSKR